MKSCEDYTEVFLCHARLYVFADVYHVEALKALALYKLRRTLAKFYLYPERVPDVVLLLQYAYSHTMDHEESIDELRDLVTDYAVCVIEVIAQDPDLQALLSDRGALAKDLVTKLLNRLD